MNFPESQYREAAKRQKNHTDNDLKNMHKEET